VNASEQLHTRDLERRLAEAEATIEALLSGQIDAVVDPKSHTPVLLAKAQTALRDERDRAQRYLDTPDVILLALDVDARITFANRHTCAVLGWPAAELLGRDWIETCVPTRTRDAMRTTFREIIAGHACSFENPVLTRSGEERLIGWSNTVLLDDQQRVVGTFSSGVDIAERHRGAEALRTAEERMRLALEAADVGVWDMDLAAGVVRWSETLEAQHGLQPGTFRGTFEAFVESIHPDDRASVLETIRTAMKSGSDFSVLNRATWPDGTVRWLSGAGRFHLGDHGEPLRGLGISLDITERRVLEAAYQQAQKMDAIGRLAGGVAHDFNNLLTVILGYCELLAADLAPDDPSRADMAEIQKAGTSAARLTRQLLAFSRKEIIEPMLLDLNVLVGDMQAMIARLIGEDVKIVLVLCPTIARVMADRGQVEQIVVNLALNARDAMPKGGTLTIETAIVELDEHYASTHFSVKPGRYVVLRVSDTGSGMTPEVQAHLFEPFFTTKDVGSGTGLGLATIHGIVTSSGGNVHAYSEVGKGSAFNVYLPEAAGASAVVDPVSGVDRVKSKSETVLVADDDSGLRDLAKRLLERQGYTVHLAADAQEAVEMFERHAPIDLLLTDVVMPGASGPELMARLAQRQPALKVIYMSGYTEDAIAQHGILNPGIAYVHKPFTADTLARKIREVLDQPSSSGQRGAADQLS
jgi:two-component system cell cycle sensor histidine kinase/response regulator CckA